MESGVTDECDIEAAMMRDEALSLGRIPWRWARLPGLTLAELVARPSIMTAEYSSAPLPDGIGWRNFVRMNDDMAEWCHVQVSGRRG